MLDVSFAGKISILWLQEPLWKWRVPQFSAWVPIDATLLGDTRCRRPLLPMLVCAMISGSISGHSGSRCA